MLLPLLFLALSTLLLILTQIKPLRKNKWVYRILIIGVGAFFLASIPFGIVFSTKEFAELDVAKVVWATLFLFLAIGALFGFVLTRDFHSPFPFACLFSFLLFGVLFLAFAFSYGRSNLDNETVVSSVSSALAMVKPFLI